MVWVQSPLPQTSRMASPLVDKRTNTQTDTSKNIPPHEAIVIRGWYEHSKPRRVGKFYDTSIQFTNRMCLTPLVPASRVTIASRGGMF